MVHQFPDGSVSRQLPFVGLLNNDARFGHVVCAQTVLAKPLSSLPKRLIDKNDSGQTLLWTDRCMSSPPVKDSLFWVLSPGDLASTVYQNLLLLLDLS